MQCAGNRNGMNLTGGNLGMGRRKYICSFNFNTPSYVLLYSIFWHLCYNPVDVNEFNPFGYKVESCSILMLCVLMIIELWNRILWHVTTKTVRHWKLYESNNTANLWQLGIKDILACLSCCLLWKCIMQT